MLKNKQLALKKRKIKFNDWQLYALMLLPLLQVFIFHYLPMCGIVIAFKDFKYSKGIFGSEWVGFDNFEFFFKSDTFVRILKNTLLLNFAFIILGILLAVTVAIMLYHVASRKATKLYQTVVITPNFISWVIASYMVYAFLNPQYGLINGILSSFGRDTVNWYSEPKYWPFILIICNIWKHVGMDSIMYYAALMGVDSSLFEAAEIDGANRWQVIKHIMLPSLKPIIVILTILNIGKIFRADFGLFYNVPRNIGLLYETTDVVDTYVFRAMRELGDMGMSAAVGLLQSCVGFVMVMITNAIVKKIEPENAMF